MRISLKLIIIFLCIVAIPLLFVGTLIFNNAKENMLVETRNKLALVATNKAEEISLLIHDLEADLKLFQNNYFIKNNFSIILEAGNNGMSPESKKAEEILDNQLGGWLGSKRGIVNDIMLVSQKNRIVYSLNPEHKAKELGNPLPDPLNLAFEQGKEGIYITDVFKNEQENNDPSILASGPLQDKEGNFTGLVVLHIDMSVLYEQLMERTVLGSTGELYLINKDKIMISPSIFINNAVLNLKVNTENAKRCFQFSDDYNRIEGVDEMDNEPGIWVFPDYRGVEVLGTNVYIPELQWGLLVEIDAEEAFAQINNLKTLSLIIILIVLVLVIIVTFSISRALTKPIKLLQKGVEIIGTGNLDYKVGTTAKDEVGQLSRAFDEMIKNLRKVTASRDELNKEIAFRKLTEEEVRKHRNHLEELVEKRTVELKRTNENLRIEINEHKKAEEELRESEEKFHGTVMNLMEGFYSTTIDGKLLDYNKEFQRILGLEPNKDYTGLELPDFLLDWKDRKEYIKEFMKKGFIKNYIINAKKLDGKKIIVEINSRLIKEKLGKPARIEGTFLDITERRQAEEELQMHRNHLEDLVKERTKEIGEKNKELKHFNKLFVGREFRIKELREKVKELEQQIRSINL